MVAKSIMLLIFRDLANPALRICSDYMIMDVDLIQPALLLVDATRVRKQSTKKKKSAIDLSFADKSARTATNELLGMIEQNNTKSKQESFLIATHATLDAVADDICKNSKPSESIFSPVKWATMMLITFLKQNIDTLEHARETCVDAKIKASLTLWLPDIATAVAQVPVYSILDM